jgi:hypothetical protein
LAEIQGPRQSGKTGRPWPYLLNPVLSFRPDIRGLTAPGLRLKMLPTSQACLERFLCALIASGQRHKMVYGSGDTVSDIPIVPAVVSLGIIDSTVRQSHCAKSLSTEISCTSSRVSAARLQDRSLRQIYPPTPF